MSASRKFAGIVTLLWLVSGCSGSGGGDSLAPQDAACVGTGCGRENEAPAPPDEPSAPLACGTANEAACPQGYRCVDNPADSCDAANGDADCGGTCVLGGELPGCGASQEPCPPGSVCVDDPDDDCRPDPNADCPAVCRPQAEDDECTSDADCPPLDARCEICADGTTSCVKSLCNAGRCTVEIEPCAGPPQCGGIAGFTCEPGFRCIDDPADDCDPNNGGADCGGLCIPEENPGRCGAGEACPPGFECVLDQNDGCGPNASGTDCGGVCKPVGAGECTSDDDCASLRAPCFVCADGNELCPRSFCDGGRCNVSVPTCVPPIVVCGEDAGGCPPGESCVPAPDNSCDPATGTACKGVCVPDNPDPRTCGGIAGDTCPPGYECIDDRDDCDPNDSGADCPGHCELVPPPPCTSDEDCAVIQAACAPCPDGTFACPRAECLNGACSVTVDACKGPGFCGGVAGFPCPPGTTCVDDPSDECDPNNGGADCAGMCVREEQPPRCGGLTGEACPEGWECKDDTRDDCDPDDGGADCPGVCEPTPGGECSSDADCPVIGAPCQICADGTAACPRSLCTNGKCTAEFPTCAEVQ